MIRAQKGVPTKRQRWQTGALVEVPLEGERWSYGQLGHEPCVGFFDGCFTARPSAEAIMQLPLLFKLWIYRDVVSKGYWIKFGTADVRPDIALEDQYYKQDPISGGLYLHHSKFSDTDYERPASLHECEGLECAAVWEAGYVEERLQAYYSGGDDKWSRSLAIDVARVPEDQREGR